jgi:exosortase/archaeosortase family protein
MSPARTIPIKEGWKRIPIQVKLFLLKGILLFIGWKLLYLLLLLPNRTLDRPLTATVAISTAKTLNFFARSPNYSVNSEIFNKPMDDGSTLPEPVMQLYYHRETTPSIANQEKVSPLTNQVKVLSIADVCNGLEVMVLYSALILCLPASPSRKLTFIAGGLVLIFLVNIIRCAALVQVYLYKPRYVNFFHHYLFTFLVYALIFWLWSIFAKKTENSSFSPAS